MPAHLNDLPDEILLKIVDGLSEHQDFLRSLRFVSKRWNNLVELMIFEAIRISPCSFPARQICEAITAEITSGRTTVLSRATTRADVQLDRSGTHTEEQIPWLEVVRFLTPTLINLRSLRWSYYPCMRYSSRFIAHFISTLGSLPSLKELSVVFQSNDFRPDFSLEPISDLLLISIEWRERIPPTPHVIQEISSLLSRSPGLESFTFNIPQRYRVDNPPSFGDIFRSFAPLPPELCLRLRQIKLIGVSVTSVDYTTHSRHFKSLETLQILSNGGPLQSCSTMAAICQYLEREQVHLKHFAAESVHPPEIFHYLSSYSGLEHLCFHPIHLDDDSAELVDRFFFSVLPLHSHSLKSLEFGTHDPTAWTKLNEKHLEQVGKCSHLRDLCCWIRCTTPLGAHTDELLKKWLQTATRLPRLQKFIFHPTLTEQGEVRGGLWMSDADARKSIGRIERYVRNVIEKFENDHEPKFALIMFPRRHY